MTERTWTAVCTCEDGWWVVDVPEARNACTQAKRLDQVPARVVEVLKLMEGVDVDPAEVALDATFPGHAGATARMAREVREQLKAMQSKVDALTVEALTELMEVGLPQRDVGALLGITHQRVAQIANEHREVDA